ncbi:radical SAM protein [Thermosulfuriphilus sp.]
MVLRNQVFDQRRVARRPLLAIIRRPGLEERLKILAEASKFDLAGSCHRGPDGRGRRRGPDNRWIYPITLPNGRRMTLFKTLISNVCLGDCAYCPLRAERDFRRVSLSPEETVRIFMDYYRRGWVNGIFISSGVIHDPDTTMELLNRVGRLLRFREGYRGYLHLKVIPGASRAAIEEAAMLANAVSINLETAGRENFRRLSKTKDYFRDIVEPLKYIANLKERLKDRGRRLSQTTQFVVGAAGESDREILLYLEALYRRLGLNRVYFSAYQPGAGRPGLPGETLAPKVDLLTREHRLYQVDFLVRQYGFTVKEIPLKDGFLPLEMDPKEAWARENPSFFPVNVNRASRTELLRVPGLGPTLVDRILKLRRKARLRSLEGLSRQRRLLDKASRYVTF